MPEVTAPKIVFKPRTIPKETEELLKKIATADSTLAALSPFFRCGFEFETMASFDKTSQGLSDEYQDWDLGRRYNPEDAMAYLSKKHFRTLPRNVQIAIVNKPYVNDYSVQNEAGVRALTRDLFGDDDPTISQIFKKEVPPHFNAVTRALAQAGVKLTTKAGVDFPTVPWEDWLAQKVGVDKAFLNAGTDPSVKGIEWRTKGPRTVEEFIDSVAKIMAHPHLVTPGCSFHIHLSSPGIVHSYGSQTQQHFMEFLLSQDVPKSVRERWKSDAVRYFKLNLSADKHTFVSHSTQYKTWEFRCWGNISTVPDAVRCLELSMMAYQYAVRCRLAAKSPKITTGFGEGNATVKAALRGEKLLELEV